jgi:hypothetical protein
MNRRTFLKIASMGSVAVAAGCSAKSEDNLFTMVQATDDMVTGKEAWYASTCRECPAGCGVLAKNREGRVIKLEGNGLHPVNRGTLCIRGQAASAGPVQSRPAVDAPAENGGRVAGNPFRRRRGIDPEKGHGQQPTGGPGASPWSPKPSARPNWTFLPPFAGISTAARPWSSNPWPTRPSNSPHQQIFGNPACRSFAWTTPMCWSDSAPTSWKPGFHRWNTPASSRPCTC